MARRRSLHIVGHVMDAGIYDAEGVVTPGGDYYLLDGGRKLTLQELLDLRDKPVSPVDEARPVKYGNDAGDDEIARQILIEHGIVDKSANTRSIWKITDAQAARLWQLALKEAHRLLPQLTSLDRKTIRLRHALGRVTGRPPNRRSNSK
jgi:hypothetical protein